MAVIPNAFADLGVPAASLRTEPAVNARGADDDMSLAAAVAAGTAVPPVIRAASLDALGRETSARYVELKADSSTQSAEVWKSAYFDLLQGEHASKEAELRRGYDALQAAARTTAVAERAAASERSAAAERQRLQDALQEASEAADAGRRACQQQAQEQQRLRDALAESSQEAQASADRAEAAVRHAQEQQEAHVREMTLVEEAVSQELEGLKLKHQRELEEVAAAARELEGTAAAAARREQAERMRADALAAQLAKAEAALRSEQAEVETQGARVRGLEEDLSRARREMALVEESARSTGRQAVQLQQSVRGLEDQASAADSKALRMESDAADLRRQLEDERARHAAAEQSLEANINDLHAKLRAQPTLAEEEINTRLQRVDVATRLDAERLERATQDLTAELERRVALCESLQADVAQRDRTIASLEDGVAVLRRNQLSEASSIRVQEPGQLLWEQRQADWESERRRLVEEVSVRQEASAQLKRALEPMIARLEAELRNGAAARQDERRCWQKQVAELEAELALAKAAARGTVPQLRVTSPQRHSGLGAPRVSSPAAPPAPVKDDAQPSEPQSQLSGVMASDLRPDATQSPSGILSRIEQHLERMAEAQQSSAAAAEPTEPQVNDSTGNVAWALLQQELGDKRVQLGRLERKYKTAKVKWAQEARERRHLRHEVRALRGAEDSDTARPEPSLDARLDATSASTQPPPEPDVDALSAEVLRRILAHAAADALPPAKALLPKRGSGESPRRRDHPRRHSARRSASAATRPTASTCRSGSELRASRRDAARAPVGRRV
eukprot:TRINITY_DN1394_c0_g1_i3.p1 TRINITY_DN1394_c0_g1~~TRINITY_DN1394_c0_g1_i3.p1  ORF type:complete len:823 (+),score=249.97 TRINITY_DN1394_c0_g1_i3:79-2469(+)